MSTADWQAIERDHRAGLLSLREIGDKHGISHVSVTKRAKKEGWTRDLTARIRAKAEELVNKEAANTEVNEKEKSLTEREIVQANAEIVAEIKKKHRKTLGRWQLMVEDLEARINADKSLTILQRAQVIKTAVDALRNLIAGEREAYNFDAEANKPQEEEQVDRREIARRVAFMFAQTTREKHATH